MKTLMGKVLCWINYYKNRNYPLRKHLSPEDFSVVCGVEDKWWYI